MGHIERDYKPAPAILKDRGHDIMVSWEGQNAGKIKINGVDYKLLQCHWHSPSEHKINGITFDEELHILHQDSKGVRAVISVLFKIGSPDPFISKLFNHIKSLHPNEEKKLGIVDPGTIGFWSGKYYRYIGSLTIPPCTEGVVWTIFAHPKTLSAEQVQALKEALSDESRENARPIQHLHGRLVEASSH
ncbi:alpha carbonic anhydrase 4-like [Carica papaya]|uniref:alpha carbonic anhydrase 4-like n=1 Tax=Carica papaya TaxID=3649 RepID=UPI000B8CFDF1|nr:alpha carbonic anhydrase 4-like [Carica papaya]